MREKGEHPSVWVLVTRRPGVAGDAMLREAEVPPPADLDDISVWTDDFVNLLEAIRRR